MLIAFDMSKSANLTHPTVGAHAALATQNTLDLAAATAHQDA